MQGEPPPYHDELGPDGLLHYRYRGTDPNHRDNVGMKLAAQRNVPLIYLFGIVPGEYLPIWPVYVVGADDATLTFRVAVDDRRFATEEVADFEGDMKRAYVARATVQRLHQQSFRRPVLRAYRERCSVCRLEHAELLDAAHILPDTDPRGEPVVSNGLAHPPKGRGARVGAGAAFFRRPERKRPGQLRGPRTRPAVRSASESRATSRHAHPDPHNHGLQEMDGGKLYVPRSAKLKPRREFLEARYETFRKAA